VSLFWLSYRRHGKLAGVVLIEAPDLMQSRLQAAVDERDQAADFAAGHELNDEVAARIPAEIIGRLLAPTEVRKLLRHLERADPISKRPPAPSIPNAKSRRKPGRAR
jgi:hypothetical protein